MSSPNYDYLDGNAAAGELSKVFAVDITTAAARCAECACEHVLLRLVNVREQMFLDVRGMAYLRLETSRPPQAS